MNYELNPSNFGFFFQSLENALVIEKLIGEGFQRGINREGHKLYSDGTEANVWKIVYSNSYASIELTVTEFYVGSGYINHINKGRTTFDESERLSNNGVFWRIPLAFKVSYSVEGKDTEKIGKKVALLLQSASQKPKNVE